MFRATIFIKYCIKRVALFAALGLIYAPTVPCARAEISPESLGHEVAARLMRVREYQFIREEAAKLGKRVYLFGGTAAAFANYVRWDQMRANHPESFNDLHFDYSLAHISPTNKDLDLVIDGNESDAVALEQALQAKFPRKIAGTQKSAWEVRPLFEARMAKAPLAGQEDFLRQNNDTLSTGLIELSGNEPGSIYDLRDLGVQTQPLKEGKPLPVTSTFIRDLAEGKIRFLRSPLHSSTQRAREESNPELLSVIRYLVKAFEYDLEIPPDSEAAIRKIVAEYPADGQTTLYVREWLHFNGRKLVWNPKNLERAYEFMDRIGLRRKLIRPEDVARQDALSWWLAKDPLKSKALGQGDGATAADLGIREIAHETNSVAAYLQMSYLPGRDVNVFVSRQETVGEAAVHGAGFYASVGRKGARGSGLTLRYLLKPEARLGEDFDWVRIEHAAPNPRVGDYLIIKNRQAIEPLPEKSSIGIVELVHLIQEGKIGSSDQGLIEAIKQSGRLSEVTTSERSEVQGLLLKSKFSGKNLTLLSALLGNQIDFAPLIKQILSGPPDSSAVYEVEAILKGLPPVRFSPADEAAFVGLVEPRFSSSLGYGKLALALVPTRYFNPVSLLQAQLGGHDPASGGLPREVVKSDGTMYALPERTVEAIAREPISNAEREEISRILMDAVRMNEVLLEKRVPGRDLGAVFRIWAQYRDHLRQPESFVRVFMDVSSSDREQIWGVLLAQAKANPTDRAPIDLIFQSLESFVSHPEKIQKAGPRIIDQYRYTYDQAAQNGSFHYDGPEQFKRRLADSVDRAYHAAKSPEAKCAAALTLAKLSYGDWGSRKFHELSNETARRAARYLASEILAFYRSRPEPRLPFEWPATQESQQRREAIMELNRLAVGAQEVPEIREALLESFRREPDFLTGLEAFKWVYPDLHTAFRNIPDTRQHDPSPQHCQLDPAFGVAIA